MFNVVKLKEYVVIKEQKINVINLIISYFNLLSQMDRKKKLKCFFKIGSMVGFGPG